MSDAPLVRALRVLLGRDPALCYVHPLTHEGLCRCGVCGPGRTKHPVPPRRLTSMPVDYSDQSDDLARTHSDGRFGVLAGPNDLVIVDVDVKHNKPGRATIELLHAQYKLPNTLVQSTPTRGLHLFFRRPASRAGVAKSCGREPWGPGIDVRVGPQELVIGGAGYTLLAMPDVLPELPEALFDRLPDADRGLGSVQNVDKLSSLEEDPEALAWAEDQFAAYCTELAPGGAGNRNEPLGVLAMQARALGLPPARAVPIAWERWNSRCDPPLSDPTDREFWKQFEHRWSSGRSEVGGVLTYQLSKLAQEIAHPKVAEYKNPIGRKLHDPNHTYSFTPCVADPPKLHYASIAEVTRILEMSEVWSGVFQLDTFNLQIRAVDPPMRLDCEGAVSLSKADKTSVRLWFAEILGKSVGVETLDEAILWCASRRKYNALSDYFATLPDPGDGAELVLERFARETLGIESPNQRKWLKMQLVGSVARALNPGAWHDLCVVLIGDENVGKSKLLSSLYGQTFFTDFGGSVHDKDAMVILKGRWCVELAEFASAKRSEREALLGFISRPTDVYRAPYEREAVPYPRQCVFWATTNDREIIGAEEGDRRFMPVLIARTIDLDRVERERDDVWAAAKALYLSGARFWFAGNDEAKLARAAKADFASQDELAYRVRDILAAKGGAATALDIWIALCGGDVGAASRFGKNAQMSLARVLRSIGARRTFEGPHRVRKWEILEGTPEIFSASKNAEMHAAKALIDQIKDQNQSE